MCILGIKISLKEYAVLFKSLHKCCVTQKKVKNYKNNENQDAESEFNLSLSLTIINAQFDVNFTHNPLLRSPALSHAPLTGDQRVSENVDFTPFGAQLKRAHLPLHCFL